MGRLLKDKTHPTDPMAYQDPQLKAEIGRLHQLTVYGRWLFVFCLWITVGLLSFMGLRSSIDLWLEYFTWAAFRAAFRYNGLATAGLGLCLGTTLAVLLWQSRNILFGLPKQERTRLRQRVMKIRQQGHNHPLWKLVCQSKSRPQ
ncbi:hypothetical protein C1752_04411 [Acaryochloris thomasi RCC1774]|uniref:Uncharacterized protein n=1 Tax=Acaryochloris thomasi RCC1774 TaxID=1764569 RepID=A0A2W1JTL7_9CYAN|nr:hypothetical protein [Acaryochloris thomasi]PZD71977.1 hypothetical protein C1752_04411 [Acaryochloris thomasi RCC1774]